jgi:hypothetical protein
MTITGLNAQPKAAALPEAAELESKPAMAPSVPENDPSAKAAFDAVMSVLTAPPEKAAPAPTALETAVRPAAKQAAPAANTQSVLATVDETARKLDHVAPKTTLHFISRYPTLTLYVDVGFREQHQGVGIVRNVPIRFKDGRYLTENLEVAKALRAHPKFNAMFQEAQTAQLAAYVAGAARAREMMRSNITAGPASSADSNDFAQMGRMTELDNIDNTLFRM